MFKNIENIVDDYFKFLFDNNIKYNEVNKRFMYDFFKLKLRNHFSKKDTNKIISTLILHYNNISVKERDYYNQFLYNCSKHLSNTFNLTLSYMIPTRSSNTIELTFSEKIKNLDKFRF